MIMPQKTKHRKIDWGQVIGAVIFIALFVVLIYLGVYSDENRQFDNSFFEDIGKVMQE